MSRHRVRQSDDHKGNVDRFCFNSNLAFIMPLVGIKDTNTQTKKDPLELRFGYKYFSG